MTHRPALSCAHTQNPSNTDPIRESAAADGLTPKRIQRKRAKPAFDERPCYCLWESWAGRTRQDGVVVGETPKFYRVRFDKESHGKPAGRVVRVRKEHVRFDPPKCAECDQYPADLPSDLCPGCEAYQEHQR